MFMIICNVNEQKKKYQKGEEERKMKQFWDAKKKNEVRKNDYSTRVWKYLDCTLKIHVHFTIHEILHFARIWYVVGRLAIRDFQFFILWFMFLFKCWMCMKKK